MMRSMQSRQMRTPTSSQDGDSKTKKLGLGSSNSKNKNMSSSVSSMTSSLKRSGIDHVKNNKKVIGIGSSHSNKSLKGLRDITSSTNLNYNKIISTKKNDAQGGDGRKGGAIPVKNIRQKICGGGGNGNGNGVGSQQQHSLMNTTMQASKKTISSSSNVAHKEKSAGKDQKNMTSKHYFFNKENKKTIKSRQNSGLLNFTSALVETEQSQQERTPKGLSLQQFEVGRKLGKGRFGDVYMARDRRTGFVLAIKMINKKQLRESEMQKQLIQEIKIQMYSNHPNILKMYGFFADKNKIYLLLELATNGCLFKEVRKNGYMQQNMASFYFRQVTSGVRYLHSNSVIHRDIKPENILNCFNVLKLCDFGWAIYSPVYQRQTFCGTLDYVPPEIVTGDFYDEKADVWCLGVLCYELCTGKAPFESTSDENETYDKILKVNIEFPIYLSPQIVDFVGKILTRDPSKRLSLEEVESHEWMRLYENEAGRMISKEIWDRWMSLSKPAE